MKFFDRLVQQRRFVYMAVTLLSLAGIMAALRLPASIYPELKFQRITIVAEGNALSARQQMFSVTRPLEQAVPPIADAKGVSRKGVHWVRPELDAQVGFSEWTPDGKLRHPRFLGLRDDKRPKQVVRERSA